MTQVDLSIFEKIPSQTTTGDRRSLLLIQRALRRRGDYVYLEIGSHLGGTIQPHYEDVKCRRIYSIDKRPLSQPDERGEHYAYPENSTQAMRDNLRRAFPTMDASRLVTFDADAADVDPADIREPPDLCFIDGEHTNVALESDMRFCLRVVKPDGVLCTHDSGVVGDGILAMKQELQERGVPFTALKPGGSVYVFALGKSGQRVREILSDELQDERKYFRGAAFYLRRLQREVALRRYPLLLGFWRMATGLKDALYRAYGRTIRSVRSGVAR